MGLCLKNGTPCGFFVELDGLTCSWCFNGWFLRALNRFWSGFEVGLVLF